MNAATPVLHNRADSVLSLAASKLDAARLKQVQAIENAPPEPKATAKQLTDRLFEYYDKLHAAEWDAQFEAAHQKETAGDW